MLLSNMEAKYSLTDGLSYDDVLLLPGYSDTLPKDCDIRTTLCGGISLNMPIVSAAMDTVTEEKLAMPLPWKAVRE
jgi:IMP dehydrogenase